MINNIEDKINRFFDHQTYAYKSVLCNIMDANGSDKGGGASNNHNYTTLYHAIFNEIKDLSLNIFEVGLGTNNPSIPSSMGVCGIPGASVRGWKQYFHNSNIFGADVDQNILFQEERIKTFYVDQLNSHNIYKMWTDINTPMDIIIDDGLHTFDANENFYLNSIMHLKSGGLYIIEDIVESDLYNQFIEKLKPNLTFIKLIKLPVVHSYVNNNNLMIIVK